jgi:cephalosporin hydroxylase/GT2 family glycosyltransferase
MDSTTRELVNRFHEQYYRGPDVNPPWKRVSFLGVETVKCPLDLWIYQELLFRTRPEVIVESGVHRGGTTLYLASMCDLLGQGEILACDLSLRLVHPRVVNHSRVRLFEGSSTSRDVHSAIAERCRDRRTMVILDSNHAAAHVLNELRHYGPLVTPGCYLICEDTNINGHPVYPEFGEEPFEAVSQYLREDAGWQVDRDCEKLLLSFNPSGYLLRVAPAAARPTKRCERGMGSVIIPCYGQLEFTRQCIDALVHHTHCSWELIIIDNASTDGTAEYLAGLQQRFSDRLRVVHNEKNLGFPAACNQGLAAARGEYLVLLNNDAIVTDGWLDQLIALADSSPTIGLAGPMSNYVSPPQLVENVPYTDMGSMHSFASEWRAQHRGKWFEASKLSGFCVLIKRGVYEAVGGLDERFGIGFFDDDDLGLRVRKAGFRLAVAQDLFVHHFGSRTFVGAGINAEQLLRENQQKFAAKWGAEAGSGTTVSLKPWGDSNQPPADPNGDCNATATPTIDQG